MSDPVDGKRDYVEMTFTGNDYDLPRLPSLQDWVLVLERTTQAALETDTVNEGQEAREAGS